MNGLVDIFLQFHILNRETRSKAVSTRTKVGHVRGAEDISSGMALPTPSSCKEVSI